jgi:putative pyruvate formate lyase activating enzyme
MMRQKGSDLQIDNSGYAIRGIIIRHLVLPGHPENSMNVLRTISQELSNEFHISLMSQYYPTYRVCDDEFLGRTLNDTEYSMVADELERLGFENGWVQELSSNQDYRPDFDEVHPFE